MATKSRYQHTPRFTRNSDGASQFRGLRPRVIQTPPGVLEYTLVEGDRLDLLALHFYDNTRMWWRILDANPGIAFGADLGLDDAIGETIVIPRASSPGDIS